MPLRQSARPNPLAPSTATIRSGPKASIHRASRPSSSASAPTVTSARTLPWSSSAAAEWVLECGSIPIVITLTSFYELLPGREATADIPAGSGGLFPASFVGRVGRLRRNGALGFTQYEPKPAGRRPDPHACSGSREDAPGRIPQENGFAVDPSLDMTASCRRHQPWAGAPRRRALLHYCRTLHG